MLQRVIMSPLGATLALVILFAVWSMTTGSINGWYLLTEPAGTALSERFDRVVITNVTGESADDAWKDATKGTIASGDTTIAGNNGKYLILEAGTASGGKKPCLIGKPTAAITDLANTKAYTPTGTEVSLATAAGTLSVEDGCKYTDPAQVFSGALGTLIKLILSAAGLGLPIGAIIALATFGGNFITDMFDSPLIGTIVMIIGLILVGSLLNVMTPFVDVALDSLDGNRFVMYAQGIGTLSSVIGNFWGVVIVGGLLAVAWQVIGRFRQGSQAGGGFFGENVRMSADYGIGDWLHDVRDAWEDVREGVGTFFNLWRM